MNDELIIEECRRILRRIAWRLQYRTWKISNGELPIIENLCGQKIMSSVDSKLYVEELLNSLPSKAKFIIEQVVINRIPEEIIAQQLGISQQGVNKY
ncbi:MULTISPECIES: RNA polymerase subunit sigma-24 [Brevibacillus]|uniref:RNA polymerase subunit sigma-24 n=1 Tax=Brevibacillus TaxID=55080 RepID=UPI000D0FA138|nr:MULTISPECIES: RNA polymerase subunit sigma-24 [Brevibacillus]MED1944940.1 sigma-70 family RNA polymerase sigma factor [Brevibacillus formosus]MED1996373.1 sigma-70 family RNA polymerase sigma factor [Brevibacillus formosus]MED2081342.1 sigma-70 family RNA polymerase sigma factor [Brevibacillus formosus]PSK19744.1 RNA polymerase subunit sigma-24 [Brevibacillus sp. NRRL NRS-603]